MAIVNFQQTIWSKLIQTQLETLTSLKDHSDYSFDGDIRMAEKVKILGVVRNQLLELILPGAPLSREAGADSSQFLEIDQFRYFDFEVDDVEAVQSVPGLIENLSLEASRGLVGRSRRIYRYYSS